MNKSDRAKKLTAGKFPMEPEKPKVIPRAEAKLCKKHKVTTWGGVPCWECVQAVNKKRAKANNENYVRPIAEVEYMEAASKFCEKTGAFMRGFDPGFLFSLYREINWPETISLSGPALAKIVESMK